MRDSEQSPDVQSILAEVGCGATQSKRQHKRSAYRVPVDVELIEACDDSSATRRMLVTTINVSSSGFAFESDGFVHSGAEVITTFKHLPGQPRILGVVRNCVHLKGRRHRVGVEFVRITR